MITIEQCEAVRARRPEFLRLERDGFVVYDYAISDENTFVDPDTGELCPIALNMRGTAFDMEGKIVSLPFEKFFNLGENKFTKVEDLDLSQPHNIVEKMDGSMIRTIVTKDGIRFGTRAGITDIAMMAEKFATKNVRYLDFAEYYAWGGYTTIFEFCSRKNQVVIDHPEDRLVLLAMRNNATGKYADYADLEYLAKENNIELAPIVSFAAGDSKELIEQVRPLIGTEGIVVRQNGRAFKLKAEDYVTKHRAVDGLSTNRATLDLVLLNNYDDILPLLPAATADRLNRYVVALNTSLADKQTELLEALLALKTASTEDGQVVRKAFAANVREKFKNPILAGYMFSMLDGLDFGATIRKQLYDLRNDYKKIMSALDIPLWKEFQ